MSEAPMQRLHELTQAKANGELICEVGGAEVHVQLQAGRIAWVLDARNPLAFAQYLKEHGLLDDDSLQAVMAECRRSHAPLSETILSWRLATVDQLKSALRHQIAPAMALLEQSSPTDKGVFLARAQGDLYSEDLTFDFREFSSAPARAPARSGANGASRAANGTAARAATVPPLPTAAAAAAQAANAASAKQAAGADSPEPEARNGSAPPGSPGAPGGKRPGPTQPENEPAAPAAGSNRKLLAAVMVVAALAAAGLFAFLRGRGEGTQAGAPAAEGAPGGAASAAGLTANEVVFGMASAFSGAVKESGRAMRTGVEVAFAAANERGGVAGRKIRLVSVDDGYDPARTLQAMRELVETRNAFGVVGNFGTPTAVVAAPYAAEKKVLFFGAVSGASALRKNPPERTVFVYRPTYAQETAAALHYLTEVRRVPLSRIAVFYQDDEFGRAGLAGIDEQARRLSYDPGQLLRLTYARNSADVTDAVARVKKEAARVKAVVMVATSQAAVQFIQQVKELGATDVIFANVSAVDAGALAEGLVSAGRGYTDEVVVTQVVPLPTSKASAALEYQTALEKHGVGEKPGFMSFEGFIVGSILVEGLRRAGRDLSTDALVAALEQIQDLDLGLGAPISFGPADHQAMNKVWGTMLQPDGSYRAIRFD